MFNMSSSLRIYFQPGTDLGTINCEKVCADLGCVESPGAGYDSRSNMSYLLTSPIGERFDEEGLAEHPSVRSVEPNPQ